MSNGYQKIYGLIYSLLPCYVIIYDFIYKFKLKNSNNLEVDDSKLVSSYYTFINTIKIILVIVMNLFFIYMYTMSSDYISKLVLSPFCLYALCSAGYVISKIFKNDVMMKFFNKGYTVIFWLFWFGFLIFFTVGIIREGNNNEMILFTIPFWIVGLCSLIKKK